MFGLSPRQINLSSSAGPNPSLLANLKSQSKIPSLSWGYTAGASYRVPGVPLNTFGSLTFGGYDTSRFVDNNVSFPFGPDTSREFIAELQSITSNNSTSPIFSGKADVVFDSVVTDLWLPPQACEGFQNVLGLQYNATSNYYFVNQTSLAKINREKHQFHFRFNSPTTGTIVLSMPITSILGKLYQNVTNSNITAWLSLRQARNASQYTMGRAFLQEVYLIADYERSKFSISQAYFPQNSGAKQIVAIPPVDKIQQISPPNHHSPSLSPATVAAIVLGATFFITILIFILSWINQKRRKNQRALS